MLVTWRRNGHLRRLLVRRAFDRDRVVDRDSGAIVLAGRRDVRDLSTVGDDLAF
jgi:hypothetical protein